MKEPKTINALMKHLREDCGIQINGSKQKRQLINYGYYHGYKGYRFFKKSSNSIPFSNFDEIVSVIKFDNELKALLYPKIMFIETATKNIVIDAVVKDMKDVSFDGIYKKKMNDDPGNRGKRTKRLKLRDSIHASISWKYKNNDSMISHFYDRGDDIPIWAIFETITFGTLANFINCLDSVTREELLKSLEMLSGTDTERQLLSNTLFALSGLRNAVAHNNIVFDCRFEDRKISKNVVAWLNGELYTKKITFDYLVDYFCLICCFLKHLGCEKDDVLHFIDSYEDMIAKLHRSISSNIYMKIVSSDVNSKLEVLKNNLK